MQGISFRRLTIYAFFALMVLVCVLYMTSSVYAAPAPEINLPDINIGSTTAKSPQETSLPIAMLFMLTTLSMAPYILVMTTAFVRVSIVLSFVRTAMGTQQVPPTQVLMGLALFTTFYIMAPVGKEINDQAVQPYIQKKIIWDKFVGKAYQPLAKFMLKQTRDRELKLFIKLGKVKNIKKRSDIPFWVLIPAYVLSEIKTSFEIGFMIYLPFLVVDMVVSCILMAMGMFMLSPMTISTPFKLLMFVLVDGWQLILEALLKSFK